MKVLSALFILAATINTSQAIELNASEVSTIATLAPTAGTTASTSPRYKAQLVLNDAQEAMQSGKISVFLAQQIKAVQALDAEVSVYDAIEILAIDATEVLK